MHSLPLMQLWSGTDWWILGLCYSLPSVCFGPIAVLPSEALQGGSQFHKCSWLVLGSWSLGVCLALKGTVLRWPKYVVKLLICMALAQKPWCFLKNKSWETYGSFHIVFHILYVWQGGVMHTKEEWIDWNTAHATLVCPLPWEYNSWPWLFTLWPIYLKPANKHWCLCQHRQ